MSAPKPNDLLRIDRAPFSERWRIVRLDGRDPERRRISSEWDTHSDDAAKMDALMAADAAVQRARALLALPDISHDDLRAALGEGTP